jgi:hypothetical protein
MVLLLAGNDGTTTLGVIPYKSYESCYASLKFPINPSMYSYADRVCMSGKAFDNVVMLNQDKVLVQKYPKTDWYPKD